MAKKFYITTAIDYVNAPPHLGHTLEKIQTDVIARYHRTLGEEVLFLTGTDENSLKSVQAAKREGISVRELVDENAKKFFQLKEALNLSFDDFIRTTEKRHKIGVQKFWLAIKKDIYKKKYRGLYCVGCEEFYKEDELKNGLCPEHKKKPEIIEEENYFFKLSKYQKELKKIIEEEKIKIIPETRKNEILNFLGQGLEDICISRSVERAHGWGIEVPGDKTQIIWVWVDALSNYITAIGYGSDAKKFKKYWPADIHVIGKGISRFHCVYWPAFLISAKLSLPKVIFIHGYVTIEGEKMSKSLGNVIDPFELVKKYGTDALRYFLLRESSPFEDLDFTLEKFKKRYIGDLQNGLGNLVARVLNLAKKFSVSHLKCSENKINEKIKKSWQEYHQTFSSFQFNEILIVIWELVRFFDNYLQEKRPWENKKNSKEVIENLLLGLKEISKMLFPFLPKTSETIKNQIKTKKLIHLFPKLIS